MRVRLLPYSHYKESGVPWFGLIPSHWKSLRLGSLLQERGETNEDGRVKQVLSVLRDIGVILYEEKGKIGNKRSEDIGRYKLVRHGDIVINCMNVIIGSVGLSRYEGCLSPVYYVLKTRDEDDCPEYFEKVFKVKPFQRSLVRIGNGILAHRMRIPMDLLKCELLPRPPFQEQAAIVRFIDAFDQRVNSLIRIKQRLIKLLNEQKQAIIHRALTRGLDPNARLKPSGIDWLGDVPEHWTKIPIKRLCSRMDYGTSENVRSDGTIRVLTMGHIQDSKILLPTVGSLNDIRLGLLLEKNDLLFNRTNSPDLVGKVGIFRGSLEDRISFASYLVRLRPTRENDSEYLNYLLNSSSFLKFARSQALVSLHQANLNSSRYGQMLVAVPPLLEQQRISAYLNCNCAEIIEAIASAKREIALIREYRTRLTADVVTGKLDVRGVELPAIDEPKEVEWIDTLDELEAEVLDETEEAADADD